MAIKQVLIMIDDFSSHSFDIYDNVTLYDFGTFNTIREWDYYLNSDLTIDGYGDVDYTEFLTANTTPQFYRTNYDSQAEWLLGFDKDSAYNTGTGYGLLNYTAYWQDFYIFMAENHSNDMLVQHGDWSLFALQNQLHDNNDVEIILIDIDELDLTNQLQALFH
jgi:hypothetical protein